MTDADAHTLARWRLVLGKSAEGHAITCGDDDQCRRIEELVGFLFDDPGGAGGGAGAPGRPPLV
jgi:hypothetical protein